MKKKILVIEFFNASGIKVDELSKCPACPEDVMAALQFLQLGCEIRTLVKEAEFSDDGQIKI